MDEDKFDHKMYGFDYKVPDFGFSDVSLYEEISGQKFNPAKFSNWKIFYEAIRKHPKFERMKRYIEEANSLKKTKKEEIKRQSLLDYAKKQSKSKKTINWNLDNNLKNISQQEFINQNGDHVSFNQK